MDTAPLSLSSPYLEWLNISYGFTFVTLDMVLLQVLQLQISTSLVISVLQCIVQLILVATVLQSVFTSQNMWTVAVIVLKPITGMSVLLNMLGTFEAVPVLGMLCRSTIASISVALSYVLKELNENWDKTETYLAFGTLCFKACCPLIVEALCLLLTPVINQMSVMGIIAILGMMSWAILGGVDMQQAVWLQMISCS
ncbi:hypothetical protein EDB87DRAFT_1683976 [Lactarius vividus]|nr:hypothetical protein EDB87DRAFT_1683976 [Lactarius vividus]